MSEQKTIETELQELKHRYNLLERRFHALAETKGYDFSQGDFFLYHPNALPLFQSIWNRLEALEKTIS